MLKHILLILLFGTTFLVAKTIDSIEFKGFDGDKLKPIIGIKVGDKYVASKVTKAKKIIRVSLKSAGYQKAIVQSHVSNKGSAVGLVFDIKKGNKVTIRKIKVLGNKKVSTEELTRKIINKEAEFMGWFPGRSSGTANITQLKYDAARVQDAYFARGYIDAKVATPTLKVDPVSSDATVTFRVKEGRQYKVSAVGLSIGKISGLNTKSLREELELKKGKVFDVSKLRKDIKMLSEKLANLGYAYVKVMPGFRKNARNLTMAVQYKVLSGKKITVNNIIVKGNKKTKDNVIRRYVDLAPGDLYNYEALKASKKMLSKTGYFDKVVIKPKKVSSKKINLEVDVEEAKTGSFTVGGGYGSADGWMVNGAVKERNLFGSGIEIATSVDYSKVTQSYSFSVRDPRLFDSKYSLSAGMFKRDSDYTESDTYDNLAYDKKNEIGVYASVGRQFTHTLYGSFGYSYKDVEYDDINTSMCPKDENGISVCDEDYTNYVKSSIIASLVYDSTDDYYTPREGIYAKIGFEYAGLGSAPAGKLLAEFTRFDGKFATYYGLRDQIDYDLIFRAKFKGSYIDHDTGKYVPVAERLYLGGASRGIRGFKSGTISPLRSGYRVGGYMSYVASLEASIPLSEVSKMRLTFFADYGKIWGESSWGSDIDSVAQKSVGMQVEWRSPFGPINLIFAKAIDPDEVHGDTATFEFNIGGKF